MVARFKLTPGRIILSRPGFDVNSPSLTDDQKIFDSNWNWSGVVLECGEITDPAPNRGGNGTLTDKGYPPLFIPFKRTYGYLPAVSASWIGPEVLPAEGVSFWRGTPWDGFYVQSPMPQSTDPQCFISTSGISIDRNYGNQDYDMRYAGMIQYIAYGVD